MFDTFLLQVFFNALGISSIYIVMSLGLTLIFGVLKIPNFVHGALYALGAFITYQLAVPLRLPYFVALPMSACGSFLIGALLERTIFRPTYKQVLGITPMITAMGLSFALINVMTNVWGAWPLRIPSPLIQTLVIGGATITTHRLLIILMGIGLAIGIYFFLSKTKLGRAVRAVSQDKEAAFLMGVNVSRIYMFTFGFGIMLAGIAGSLVGPIFTIYPEMGATAQTMALAIIILGGMGNLLGAIVGAFILGFAEIFVIAYVNTLYGQVVAFAVMIIVLLVKPSGLFGKRQGK